MKPTYVDVAVIGSGIAGYSAAMAAAAGGQSVVLVERRGYVGYERTGTGHDWLRNGDTPFDVFTPIGAAKKTYLRDLLDSGVRVLLLSAVAGVFVRDGRAAGVLLAGKFGTQRLCARQIIDTTDDGIVALHAGAPAPAVGEGQAGYTYRCAGVRPIYESSLPVPDDLGLADNCIRLHTSLLPNTYSVELRWSCGVPMDGFAYSRLEWMAREKAWAVHRWLRENHASFADASLADLASEVRVCGKMPRTATMPGLHGFHVALPMNPSTLDLRQCRAQADALIRSLPEEAEPAEAPAALSIHGARMQYTPVERDGLPWPLVGVRVEWQRACLPTRGAQALVGGLGASGSLAAISLVEAGVETLAVEALHDAGGTRTIGRVTGNYFGYTGGMAGRFNEEVTSLSKALGNSGLLGDRIARVLCYHEHLGRANCTMLTGHTVCDVLMEGDLIDAVIAAGDAGLVCLDAQVVLDMTSDADIAAFAGVAYEMGCPLDGSVMTNGQWGDSTSALARWTERSYSRDLDVVRGDRYDDLLRAIYTAHGPNSDLDFSPLHTLRESRRIQGRYMLTMEDVLLRHTFDDVIAVGRTPYDTHGRASSVLLNMEMLAFNATPLTARVPLRCYLPRAARGLLVGGKAPCATRDAASIFRMNADVENAGYALGAVAAQSVRENVPPDAVDIAPVQALLRENGCLPTWTFAPPVTAEDAMAALLEGDDQGLVWAVLFPAREVLPSLREAFAAPQTAPVRERLAMALAWFEDEEGLREILRLLNGIDDLRDPQALISPTGYAKRDTTWEGAVGGYHRINRCITLLGKARYADALPALIGLANRAEAGGPPVAGEDMYHKNRLDKYEVPFFNRIACLCFAHSRMADASAVDALKALLRRPFLTGYCIRDSSVETSLPLCAWLEIQLAEATARCGGMEGYKILCGYQEDARPVFRQRAYALLAELTGVRHGEDAQYTDDDIAKGLLHISPDLAPIVVS